MLSRLLFFFYFLYNYFLFFTLYTQPLELLYYTRLVYGLFFEGLLQGVVRCIMMKNDLLFRRAKFLIPIQGTINGGHSNPKVEKVVRLKILLPESRSKTDMEHLCHPRGTQVPKHQQIMNQQLRMEKLAIHTVSSDVAKK